MKIIVIGGTGLLGHEAVEVALLDGHEVTSLDINDAKGETWFTKEAKSLVGNVFEMTEDEICEVLKGYDAMVYAVGPDDRVIPSEPAYGFFKLRLVDYAAKVFRAARRAGIKKASLCSSYFLYFDRKFPEKKLSIIHPYIQVRKEQAEVILKEAKEENGLPELNVYVMELPYIFGTCPNRVPLWKDIFLKSIDLTNEQAPVYFPSGGTVMCTSRHIGECLIRVLEYGKESKHYPIGDENHPYDFMMENLMIGYLDGKPRQVIHPPKEYVAEMQDKKYQAELAQGKYRALHPKYLMLDIQYDNFYYSDEEIEQTCKELHLTRGGVKEAIIETGKECRKYL